MKHAVAKLTDDFLNDERFHSNIYHSNPRDQDKIIHLLAVRV